MPCPATLLPSPPPPPTYTALHSQSAHSQTSFAVFPLRFHRCLAVAVAGCAAGEVLQELQTSRFDQLPLWASIPTSITRLTSLTELRLHHRYPDQDTLNSMAQLKALSLKCVITSPFDFSLASLVQLTRLELDSCGIETNSTVFWSLGKLTALVNLELPSNQLSGVWPLYRVDFPNLQKLDLSSNPLRIDSLDELRKHTSLTTVDLSGTQLFGDRFLEGTPLPALQFLNIPNNGLTGSIPESLTTMTSLAYLNVSFNHFKGTIPPSLGGLKQLTTLDTNDTSLTCPGSYTSCGVPQNASSGFCRTCSDFCATCGKRKPLHWGVIVGIVAAVVVTAVFAALLYFYCFDKPLVSSKAAAQVCQEYSLATVAKATNGWSQANLLGMGGFGDVYRGVSPTDGTTQWAVKRARTVTTDFDKEVCAMATKDHPNLVKLLGFSIGITGKTRVEQILIYELMPNGDLSRWIEKGVHSNSARMCLAATLPPSWLPSSFGILMLELMTGRNVITDSFSIPFDEEAGQQLHILPWVQQQLAQFGSNKGAVAGLKDARMEARDELVLRVVQLALRCTDKQSATRPVMGVIAAELEDVLVELGGAHRNAGPRQVDRELEVQKKSVTTLDTEIDRLNDLLCFDGVEMP
ncbi:unnamed protein product [Closterium sp. NIES-65]|nr:unnamed protein product [Closterium sp. NIES-65]